MILDKTSTFMPVRAVPSPPAPSTVVAFGGPTTRLAVPVLTEGDPAAVYLAPQHVRVQVVDLQLLHSLLGRPLSDDVRLAVRGKLRLMMGAA